MSAVTSSFNPTQFSNRRTIPIHDGFRRDPIADQHFANIRTNDLIVVTRRIEPRPLVPRDQNRVYNTSYIARVDYVSQAKSKDLLNIAEYSKRPTDTRRQRVKMYTSNDLVPVRLDTDPDFHYWWGSKLVLYLLTVCWLLLQIKWIESCNFAWFTKQLFLISHELWSFLCLSRAAARCSCWKRARPNSIENTAVQATQCNQVRRDVQYNHVWLKPLVN